MKRGMYHLQAHPSLTNIMLDFGKSPSIPGKVKTVLLDKLWIFQIPDITKERCPQLRNIVPLTIIMLDFEKNTNYFRTIQNRSSGQNDFTICPIKRTVKMIYYHHRRIAKMEGDEK